MIYHRYAFIAFTIVFLSTCATLGKLPPVGAGVDQIELARVEQMPELPQPYKMKDWRQVALGYDDYVYDFEQKGELLPLIWIDSSGRNFPEPTYGLYTALGDVRQGPKANKEGHEALGVLGSILGASLVGIDKSDQDGRNYVRMARNYFNKDNGWNIIMNFTSEKGRIGGGYGNDWWYDVYPNVLFYAVGDLYPEVEGYEEIMRTIAEQHYRADSILGDNYHHTFFNFATWQPGENHIPHQEDAAAGYAYLLYSAYVKFGDPKYLRAAKHALEVLLNERESRFYEVLMPFGAYVAARLNAEEGADYDVTRLLNWTFDGTATNREGWGVIVGNWGGYDVSGLVGSTVHNGGYGFLMNGFDLAWPLVPLVRYDQRYAATVGKWLLNAANASRLFYPYEVPDSLQAIPERKYITKGVIAYEGVIKESTYEKHKGITPFVQGDGPNWAPGMPPETMFSLYGSAHVGIFGGIIQPTTVERILRLDCLATDFFQRGEAYPTYLYYNPYDEPKTISVSLPAGAHDLYDTVSQQVLVKGVEKATTITIPAQSARVIVQVPGGAKYKVEGGKLSAGEVTIDWRR